MLNRDECKHIIIIFKKELLFFLNIIITFFVFSHFIDIIIYALYIYIYLC